MLNSANRAKETIIQVFSELCKDDVFRVVWDTVDDKQAMMKRAENIVQQQLEEYAGNRPIEPDMKVVMMMPENYSNYTGIIYWKDKSTGILTPMRLEKING